MSVRLNLVQCFLAAKFEHSIVKIMLKLIKSYYLVYKTRIFVSGL